MSGSVIGVFWDVKETDRLLKLYGLGLSLAAIGRQMGRTPDSVRNKLLRLERKSDWDSWLDLAKTRKAGWRTETLSAEQIDAEGCYTPLRQLVIRPKLSSILKATAEHFGVRERDLLSPRRIQPLTRYRQTAMYFMREFAQKSYPQIGKAVGNRDHTTAMHAHYAVLRHAKNDPVFADEVRALGHKLAPLTAWDKVAIPIMPDGTRKYIGHRPVQVTHPIAQMRA
jgi:chromosomal replication initiator protein